MRLLVILLVFVFSYILEQEAPQTVEEATKAFVLENGLTIQNIAAEPMIQDPVFASFDQKGRLWVVEMRGYMPDIAGTNETEPNGRISVLQDLNNDGVMDRSTVFLDSLVLPRALAFSPNGVLVAENGALFEVYDKNDDLKPDQKLLIDQNYAGSTAPEHAGNGLFRAYDNWFYNAKSKKRYTYQNGKWLTDSTEFRGQWGMAQDDLGRLYYNYNWSQLHADIVSPNHLWRNANHKPSLGIDYAVATERRVYPIRDTYAVNRGYIKGVLDSTGRLREFTAACSPFILRTPSLGADYQHNVFVCEPAGNLIKRNRMDFDPLLPTAKAAYINKEFLATADERFRPVSLTTGPDGALYIVDMYKGLIQHTLYVTPYLKDQYSKKGLNGPLHMGRIWKLTKKGASMAAATSFDTDEQLLLAMQSTNAWHRETAQRIILDKAKTNLTQKLLAVAKTTDNEAVAIHSLWTAYNLGQVKPWQIKPFFDHKSVHVANTSVQLLQKLGAKDLQLTPAKFELAILSSEKRSLQFLLSGQIYQKATRFKYFTRILEKYGEQPIMRDALMSSLQNEEFAYFNYLKANNFWKIDDKNRNLLLEILMAALVKKKSESEFRQLLASLNSYSRPVKNTIIESLNLLAITHKNSIKLSSKIRQLSNPDFGDIAQMFSWPGKLADTGVLAQSKLSEADQKSFVMGRQQYINVCAGCHGNQGQGVARFAPKLAGSEWVTGSETRLALLVLHGIEGKITVDKKLYDSPEILTVMPAHAGQDDAVITNILNYIRNAWGNNAGALSKSLVGKTRHMNQGRVQPWTADELIKFTEKLQ